MKNIVLGGWSGVKAFLTTDDFPSKFKFLFSEWRSKTTQKFYSSYQSITDYGACCVIVPYLDLINETTINLDPAKYTGQMFHDIPTGAKNGIQVLSILFFNKSGFQSSKHGNLISDQMANGVLLK